MIARQIFTIQTKPIKLSRSPITASGADFHNKSGKLHALASFTCTSKEIFIAWRQLPYCFLFIDGVESVTASPSVLLWINNKPKVEGWWCHRSTGESCRHSWAVSNHRAQPPVCCVCSAGWWRHSPAPIPCVPYPWQKHGNPVRGS